MTNEQVAAGYDTVWTGRDYLCVRLWTPRAAHDGVLPKEVPADRSSSDTNLMRVVRHMPGTAVELQAAAGLTDRAVYAALNTLRRQGHLGRTKEARGALVVYALRTETGS